MKKRVANEDLSDMESKDSVESEPVKSNQLNKKIEIMKLCLVTLKLYTTMALKSFE